MATTSAKASKDMGESPATQADLEAQIRTLREEMAKLTAQIQSSSQRSYGAARKAAGIGVEQLRQQGEATIADLKSTAIDFEDQIESAVREKPITSLAIAAGVGFLFALIARR